MELAIYRQGFASLDGSSPWCAGRVDHVIGMLFIPHMQDLVGGLADIGAVVDLASEGAGHVERARNALVHTDAHGQVALCVRQKIIRAVITALRRTLQKTSKCFLENL